MTEIRSSPQPTEDADKFLARIGPSGALLGVDLGSKTLGLAVCDPGRLIASSLVTLRRTRFRDDCSALHQIVLDREIVGVVVGLPRNLDASSGPRVQSTRTYARNLAAALGLPILLWDERLSTAEAERVLIDANTSRKRRAAVIDKVAATLILQGAIDRLGPRS